MAPTKLLQDLNIFEEEVTFAYNLTKDQNLVNKCNEIAINEFLRRAHLYGLKEKDEKLKNFYLDHVNGCHDGNGENTPGNVFSNLMSVDY